MSWFIFLIATLAAWPERLYCIDGDGKVVYKGDLGPDGYKRTATVLVEFQHRHSPTPSPFSGRIASAFGVAFLRHYCVNLPKRGR